MDVMGVHLVVQWKLGLELVGGYVRFYADFTYNDLI